MMEFSFLTVALVYLALPVVALILSVSYRRRITNLEAQTVRMSEEILSLQKMAAEPGETAEAPCTDKQTEPQAESQTEAAPSDITSELLEAINEASGENTKDEPHKNIIQPDETEAVLQNFYDEDGADDKLPVARNIAEDLESRIGGRWSVILGGIAIAIGAVFLVRYTIEIGLLGPKVRIALGFLLSGFLFAGGEYLRRQDKQYNLPTFIYADIPGILTGTGSVAGFATLYAAYGFYGFVGPLLTFVGLTAIGLATMVLSVLHGPLLAAMGVLGSYVTPLLVSFQTPNPVALALHVVIVTAAVSAIARMREWLWLALAAVAASTIWTVMEASISDILSGIAAAIMLIGLALIYAITFVWEIGERPDPLENRQQIPVALLVFSVLAVVFVWQAGVNSNLEPVSTGLAVALIIMTVAWAYPAAASLAIVSAIIALAAIGATDLTLIDQPGIIQTFQIMEGLVPPDISAFLWKLAIITAPTALLAIHGAQRSAPSAPQMAGFLAWGASLLVFLSIVLAYMRISPFETHQMFGLGALVLAGIFAVLVGHFTRLRPDDNKAPAPAAFAVASVGLLSFSIGVSLSKEWMPLLYSLVALGIAYIFMYRPVAILPRLSVIAAVLGGIALWFSIPFPSAQIGVAPFLNYLIVLAGLPAAALIATGEILRRQPREPEASIVIAFGLAACGLFVGLELRHWLHGGEIASPYFTLADVAAQTIAALSFAIGLQFVARRLGSSFYYMASMVAGVIGAFFIALGLFWDKNPLLVPIGVGEKILANMLLPAYLIPAILAVGVAWLAKPIGPRWFTLTYASLSGMLLFIFITATTRHAYQGSFIYFDKGADDVEVWTYSAVWLVMGALVLAAGMLLQSQPVRIASGILIALTICKVFLLDMSSLTGALRAFSFIGLGLSLLVIGRCYQRILIRHGTQSGSPSRASNEE